MRGVRTPVATVLVALALAGCGAERAVSPTDPAGPAESSTSATATADPVPGWRTEHWHDVAVEVPADWWYGGGIMQLPHVERDVTCGWGAMVSPEGEWGRQGQVAVSVEPGYVGRPLAVGGTCGTIEQSSSIPVEPYLWFDSLYPVGVRRLAEGWVERTWEFEGTRMTVATTDPEVARHVVESTTGGETCLANRDDVLDPLSDVQPPEDEEALVCAYRRELGDQSEAWLTYAAPLTAERADRFVSAFESAADWTLPAGRACDLGGDDEWVVVQAAGTAYVVRPQFHGCPHVQGKGRTVRLTPDLVEPWLTGGVPAVLLSQP